MKRVLFGAALAASALTLVSVTTPTVDVISGKASSEHIQRVQPMIPDLTEPTTSVEVTVPPVVTPLEETTTQEPVIEAETTIQAVPIPQPPRISEWERVFNDMAASLPGIYYVIDAGAWGKANLNTGEVYIAPRTPLANLRSVMWHEAAHVMQGALYGGRTGADQALAPYGGIEVVADCMALEMGATWIGYGCTDAGKQGAALVFGNG